MTLIEKATAVSRLMQVSAALGGAVEVADDGAIFLTTSDHTRIRLGASIPVAVSFTAPLVGRLG